MAVTVIKLPCFGITINQQGKACAISSDLHNDASDDDFYNAAIDGVESLILAHHFAGIDVTTPEYVEGVESAVLAISNIFGE